jgi:hypothetical protein
MLPGLDIWLNHFEYHASVLRAVPTEIPNRLTDAERALIADSIATFQLGEQSEGGTLLRAVRDFARTRDVDGLVRITELFIKEEQHHAALMGTFMDYHGIPRKQSDWTDGVFRFVRKLTGYELCLHVLVAAELIGNVYYRALEVATGCQHLRVLCRMLVADELAHIGFESDVVLALRARRPPSVRWVQGAAHRLFLGGAATVVWFTHRPVLKRAGYGFRGFLRACDAQFTFYLRSPMAYGSQAA